MSARNKSRRKFLKGLVSGGVIAIVGTGAYSIFKEDINRYITNLLEALKKLGNKETDISGFVSDALSKAYIVSQLNEKKRLTYVKKVEFLDGSIVQHVLTITQNNSIHLNLKIYPFDTRDYIELDTKGSKPKDQGIGIMVDSSIKTIKLDRQAMSEFYQSIPEWNAYLISRLESIIT